MKESCSGIRLLDITVEHLLRCWPKAAQSFIAFRMACIGCAFSRFHTVRQALRIYGIEPGAFIEHLGQHGAIPDCVETPVSKEA